MWEPSEDLPTAIRSLYGIWRCGGWIGVDLFFVLSGFLVSGLLFAEFQKNGRVSSPRFFVRRGWKIYPPFLVMIAAMSAPRFLRGDGVDRAGLFAELTFLQNYITPICSHTWSLAVEEHFYLLLPLMLSVLLWLRPNAVDPFRPIVATTIGIAALVLGLRILTAWTRPDFDYRVHLFPTHLRLDSLLFGVLISYLYHFHKERFGAAFRPHRLLLASAGCVGLLPAFLIPIEESTFIQTFGLTLFYLSSGAILTAVMLTEVPRNRATLVLGAVGGCSYSIYLWHMLVLFWAFPILDRLAKGRLYSLSRVPLYIVGSIVVGMIMARLIESPVLWLRDRLFPKRIAPVYVEAQQHAPLVQIPATIRSAAE